MNKILYFRLLTLLTLIFSSHIVFGQFFSTDQNPLSVKWRSVSVGGFKIIYPQELEAEAQRMANTFTRIYPIIGHSLNRDKTLLPILLQNRGTTANGFVQLAPKKSEFYTTPPQNFDSQDWLNNLAVHELRHVAQFDKITGGRLRPFPEEAYFAYMGAAIPTWFFEGDAVSIETALTNSGRGRQPSWIMPYRSQLLSGNTTSYSKAYFGSLNNPNIGYYQLGYLITSKIRTTHGAAILDSLLTAISKKPLRPYPFSSSLKKLTGMGTRQWFLHTQEEAYKAWLLQEKQSGIKIYPVLTPVKDQETNYALPVLSDPTHILSIRSSKSVPPHFALTDRTTGRTTTLQKIGAQEQPWFSYASGKIVWDEYRADKRYGQRSYNVICTYDLQTRQLRQITHRTRYFSPSISADGKKIIAVEIGLTNQSNLIELNAQTGALLKTFPNPENQILQTPAYNRDGTSVAFISVTEKGKSLQVLDVTSAKTTYWITNTRQQLSRPVFVNDGIAFNAHFNGIDNIYFIGTDHRIAALTSARFGAFNFSPSGDNKFLFNNFDKNGYGVSETTIDPVKTDSSNFVYFGTLTSQQENQSNVFDDIPANVFPSKKHHALSGLLNVHSLSPDVDENDDPGLKLKSDNLLNTVQMYAGTYLDTDLGRIKYSAGIDFKALYPILSVTYTNQPNQGYYTSQNTLKQANWRTNEFRLRATVPFSFNAYQHNYGFALYTGTRYLLRYTAENIPLIRSVKFPFEFGASFAHSTQMAPRSLAPQWAQYLSFNASTLSSHNYYPGALYSFSSNFYFPGILPNHSFSASFNAQKANGSYRYSVDIPVVYGYYRFNPLSALKNTLLINYRFPIAFPDKEIGPIAYVRNLRGGIFANYENLGTDSKINQPKTFGLELRSSVNLLRYLPVADIGGRLIFVNKSYHQNPVAELIFNFNL